MNWSIKDYYGMSSHIVSLLKLPEHFAYTSTLFPEQWLLLETYGTTIPTYGIFHTNILETSSALQEVLQCPASEVLLHINNVSETVRGVAAWRLENGR